MQRVPKVHTLLHRTPNVPSWKKDGIRRVSSAHYESAPRADVLLRKKQKFLQKRLSGAHVPASHNALQSSPTRQELDTLEDLIFASDELCSASYSVLLRRCGTLNAGIAGMVLHNHIIENGYGDSDFLQNLLLQMYNQCSFVCEACCVFDSMPFHDGFSWNFVIRACSRCGEISEIIQMFEKMLGEGVAPNKFIYTSTLLAYTSHEALAQGERLLAQLMGINFDLDALLGNAVVGMYCKCGQLDDAKRLFDRLSERDVVSWNAMIAAHSKQGKGKEALYFFKQMQQDGTMPDRATFVTVLDACTNESALFDGRCLHVRFAGSNNELDIILGTALLNLYGKHGDLNQAWELFNRLPERSTVSWNSMITAYLLHSRTKDALVLYDQMLQQGAMPDKFIYVSILSAHATKEDLMDGKRMYSRVIGSDFQSDTVVLTAVLNMFCKCGSVKDAEETFNDTSDPDDVLWTSMITGYAQHGHGKQALQLFERMRHEGPQPNPVTYTSVLCACSREGLVDEGVRHLLSMQRDYGMKPTVEHCNCVIDLLARSGRLDEAEDLITSMSSGATHVSWTSLLDACRKHSDLDRGQRAARRVCELDEDNTSSYVLLSNITATG